MECTAFTHERWSTQHLLMRDGVHSIYSQHMDLHIRYAIVPLLVFPVVRSEAGNDTGRQFCFHLPLHH